MDTDTIHLIFDCDGTLIDSYGAITDKICRLFERHHVTCDPDEVRRLSLEKHIGYSIRTIASRHGLDPERTRAEYDGIEEDTGRIALIDGVRDVLKDPRFTCYVYTHRGPSCREILTRLGVAACFAEIVDSTYGFRNKPNSQGVDYLIEKYALDKRRTYYIGDRTLDIECGINAGVGTIFLRTSGIELDHADADYTVDRLAEIRELPLSGISGN